MTPPASRVTHETIHIVADPETGDDVKVRIAHLTGGQKVAYREDQDVDGRTVLTSASDALLAAAVPRPIGLSVLFVPRRDDAGSHLQR